MEKRSSFSGSVGFVLAAAGSAVGLGNIWRFPYLAAKDGGGRFLLIYIILALTFGFTLLMTEVAIGRKTKQSCLTAYGRIKASPAVKTVAKWDTEEVPIFQEKIAVSILASIFSLGIYMIYWEYKLIKNIKAIKHEPIGAVKELLCLLFVPFYSYYWWYTRGEKVKTEFQKKGKSANSTGLVCLLLSIFGLNIVALAIMQSDFNSIQTKAQMESPDKAVTSRHWGFLGVLASIVPFIIMPYYCVIGGWVLKYALVFITGQGAAAAGDDFFTQFITGYAQPIVYNLVFLLMTAIVIYRGVNKGIESLSKVLMPILFVLIVGIAVYSLTLNGSESTEGRTGMHGLSIYLIPDFSGTDARGILMTIMDAMGQLFYSISVAMGIMVTYGSYFKDKDNLIKSVNQIEIFDTIVAFLAGVMIIPAVYVFLGTEGLENAGPGLVFVAMPKIFAQMGVAGNILGAVFFIMVLFAALTSCISIMEAICSGMIDKGMSRKKATVTEGVIALVLSTVVCLGYNVFYFEFKLPNGSVGQILDIMDYLSNNVLMPILAIGTCILVGWILKPKTIIDEATKNGERFGRKWLYTAMIKVIAPIMLVILLLGSLGVY